MTLFLLLISYGCTGEEKVYHIGVLQWTEQVHPYRLTYRGVLDNLTEKGYSEGVNLKLSYHDARQDKAVAIKAAEDIVKSGVVLILSLGTGSTLAALWRPPALARSPLFSP